MGFVEEGESDWDREDSVNAAVISDTRVTTLTDAVRLRWIVYEDPKPGETYEFVTTEMTIRPGLLAWTYKCRWHIAAKFIRWLRHCLVRNLPVEAAIRSLRRVYVIF